MSPSVFERLPRQIVKPVLFALIILACSAQLFGQGGPLRIRTSDLPAGALNTAYSFAMDPAGGTTPYVWTATGLPAGLLMSTVGTISGTPTVAGTFPVTVNLTDSSSPPVTVGKNFSLVITSQPLVITTASLPAVTVGTAYSVTLQATGGTAPYGWTLASGNLPAGLTLSTSGLISGTPTIPGTSNFTVQVTDKSSPVVTANKALSLTIQAAALIISTAGLPGGAIGTPYSQSLSANGGITPYTWSVAAGSLPAGLTLSPAGVISGTPTVAGTATFSIGVSDSSSPAQTTTKDFSIAINANLNVTTSSLPPAFNGVAYSQALAAGGGTPPYTWSITIGSLPSGLSLSSSGTISGTPTTSGNFNFTAQVLDSANPAQVATRGLTLTVNSNAPALTITTASLPPGTAGAAYTQNLAASGGATPYTWSITSGTLPDGLNLSTTGTISGTPAAAGTSTFTVKVTDSSSSALTATQSYTLNISAAGLTVTTASLPAGSTGSSYSQSLAASGGTTPYRWTITSGTLPAGLSLSTSGTISGTPTGSGPSNFTVQVQDSAVPTQAVASKALSITINASGLVITTDALPGATILTPYDATLSGSGGVPPYTWSITGGQLPPGITLSQDGALSGTPSAAGSFNVAFTLTDSTKQTATRLLTLVVQAGAAITTASPLPASTVGVAYAQQLEASRSDLNSWSLASGTLPAGLSLSSDGKITGTPTAPGTFDFAIQVTGGTPPVTVSKAFRLTVNASLVITTDATLPGGALNGAYSATLAASGGIAPYNWSLVSGALPAGISLSASGVISGTPTAGGTFTPTIRVTDSSVPAQSATRAFSLVIASQSFAITTTTLPAAIQNSPYTQSVTAIGGTTPYTWTIVSGSLPAGLSLSTGGTISGAPTGTGTSSFTLQVQDSTSTTRTQTLSLTVNPPVSGLSITGLPVTANPAQQLSPGLTLASPYSTALSGELTMSFSPNAIVPVDDPTTRFSNGTRSVSFTIPANSTTAVFPSQTLLLTGTVAGTISLNAQIQNGPAASTVFSLSIPSLAPQITGVTAVRVANGLQVQITGYSPERRVTNATFVFDIRTASGVQQANLSRSVESDFSSWFTSSGATAYGSSFRFVQSFTIQGDTSQIEAVTVTLTNGLGSTTFPSVPITN